MEEKSIIAKQTGLAADSMHVLRPIYVVLGMHRSGTSLCSSILNLLGIDMAEEEGAGIGNEAGHWERWPLVALQDEVLAAFNRTYYSPTHDFPLPLGWWTQPRLRPVLRRIKSYIAGIAAENRIFGFKDPRTTKLLPMWKRLFRDAGYEPYYIICLRNPSHVAASLNRRDKLPSDVGEMRALDYLINAVSHTEGCRRHFIRYENWFNNFAGTFNDLVDFLRLEDVSDGREILQAAQASVRPHMNHGPKANTQPRQSLVRHFYSIVEQLADAVEGADQKAQAFIDSYMAFQQLITPFETLQKEQLDQNSQLRLALAERESKISLIEQGSIAAQQALVDLQHRATVAEQAVQAMEAEREHLIRDRETARTQATEQAQQLQAAAVHIDHLENCLQNEREKAARWDSERATLEQRLTILQDSLADHHSAYKLLEQRLLA